MARNPLFFSAPRARDLTTGRQAYLGGTDIAPILGVSERRTRFSVWASKLLNARDDGDNEEEAAAGTFLEPFILRRFAERFDVRVHACTRTYYRRGAPFLGANPDGLVRAPGSGAFIGLVDAKTRSPFMRGLWGEAGSADVPPDEFCQMQWYEEILDLPVAYLAVLFDRALNIFVIPRDRDLGALAVEEATAFWNDYVIPRREPPFEGAAAHAYLRHKYPRVTEPMKDASASDDILVARRLLIQKHLAVLKDRLSATDATLKARIADAPGIAGTGWLARWSDVKARTSVDRAAILTELLSFPLCEDPAAAATVKAAIERTIARHTTEGEPTRSLRVFFRGPRSLPDVELEPITRAALPAAPKEDPDDSTP